MILLYLFSLNKFVGSQSDHAINKVATARISSLPQKICTPLVNELSSNQIKDNVEWNNRSNKILNGSCFKKLETTKNIINQSNNVNPNMNFTSSVIMTTSTTPLIKPEHNIKETAVGQNDNIFQNTKMYSSNIVDSSASTAINSSESSFNRNFMKNDQQILMSTTLIANEIIKHGNSESGTSKANQLNYNPKVIKNSNNLYKIKLY